MGTHTLYSANEAGPVFAEMRSLVAKTVGIHARPAWRRSSPLKEKSTLLLSTVRWQFREGHQSNVDLMVVGRVHFADVVERIADAQKTLNREINPTVYTAKEFRSKVRGNFLKTVLGGKKLFVIGDENVLRDLGHQ